MSIDNRNCFLVNLRDGLTCRRCGRAPRARESYHRGFEYHHRRHRAHGGPDVAENLLLVCYACHLDHHEGRVDLATLPERPTPSRLDCRACAAPLDPRRVEMNCGWYRCGRCRRRTHLFDHFGFVEAIEGSEECGPLSPVPGGEG